MTDSGLTFSVSGNIVVLVALQFAAVCATIIFYHFTLPPLTASKRIALSVFRAFVLVLLLLLALKPIMRVVTKSILPPVIAVLVDVSKSMTIRDGKGDRATIIHRLLKNDFRKQFPQNIELEYIPFAQKLYPVTKSPDESLPINGELTNISEALGELKSRIEAENIQAVVLASDGNYTAGRNPLYDALALGIPIYTVSIGDSAEQKDVLIESVMTNSVAFSGTSVPVDVTIKSSGYQEEKLEVSLSDGHMVLARGGIALKEGINEYHIRLFFRPSDEGTKKLLVAIPALPGEITDKNNTHAFYVKVLRSKMRVVLFGDAPSADLVAVQRSLLDDGQINVQSYVQRTSEAFYDGIPQTSTIDSADCIIFLGFPSAGSGGKLINQIQEEISKYKKPLLFISGKSTDYSKLRSFESVLPMKWSGQNSTEFLVSPNIAEDKTTTGVISLGDGITADTWRQLPPIYRTQMTFAAKAEAVILATQKLQNLVRAEPLIVCRSMAGQKTFAITGYGIWRWQLAAQGGTSTNLFLQKLVTSIIRWLTAKDDESNSQISPAKNVFTTAEPVQFTGQVFDNELRPVDDAEVVVDLGKSAGQRQIRLNPIGNGRYEGSADGLAAGEYAFTGKSVHQGILVGQNTGRFSIGQVNVEFLETKMNKSLLEQLAYQTGGKNYDDVSMGQIGADIGYGERFSLKVNKQETEVELWGWHYLGMVIIGIFLVELVIRKRSGMV